MQEQLLSSTQQKNTLLQSIKVRCKRIWQEVFCSKTITKIDILAVAAFLILVFAEPAFAQSWGNKVAEQANNVKTNMRLFAGAICGAVLMWIAFQIMWGGKRLAETQNYWVGIVLIVVVEELIAAAIT